jgi:hypoxanthine-guanine phosphoribosyltransferase
MVVVVVVVLATDGRTLMRVERRVEKLAHLISRDYLLRVPPRAQTATGSAPAPILSPTGLVAICVLKGGHQFFADLLQAVKRLNATSSQSVPLSLEFMRVKSYVDDTSSGQVTLEMGGETWEHVRQRFEGKVSGQIVAIGAWETPLGPHRVFLCRTF